MAKKRKRGGESMSAYFRKVFSEKPEWLDQKSNDVVLARYRSDHSMGAEDTVEGSVKGAMANIKSIMRKEVREGSNGARAGRKPTTTATSSWIPPKAPSVPTLETLEELIDEGLVAAKSYDRAGLEQVIRHLRAARNLVVWKMGKSD